MSSIESLAELCDGFVVMATSPGYGGKYLDMASRKLSELRELLKNLGRAEDGVFLSVDGGVSSKSAPDMVRAGANVLVVGSEVFKSDDINATVRQLMHSGKE